MNYSSLDIQQEIEATYRAVGEAITAWSMVESAMCDVFTSCIALAYSLGGHGFCAPGAPPIAFHSIENFRTKLTVTDRVVRHHLSGSQCEQNVLHLWQRAHDHCRRLSAKRNQLAHWQIMNFENRKPGQRCRLMPQFLSHSFNKEAFGSRQGGIPLPDIVRHTGAFCALSERLHVVRDLISSDEELRSRYVEAVAAMIHNLGQTDPSAAERVRQRLTSPA